MGAGNTSAIYKRKLEDFHSDLKYRFCQRIMFMKYNKSTNIALLIM